MLCASVRLVPIPDPDETEEMIRLAGELSDGDVVLLQHFSETEQHSVTNQGRTVFSLKVPNVEGMHGKRVLGICGKLQSMGLIADSQQHALERGGAAYPTAGGYWLFGRADRFLVFMKAAYEASDCARD